MGINTIYYPFFQMVRIIKGKQTKNKLKRSIMKDEDKNMRAAMKKISYEAVFTIAECVCMVSGLISFLCGNSSLGCSLMCLGITNLCLALYYRDNDKKNVQENN